MELKSYQKSVLADLSRFLVLLTGTGSAAAAYRQLWEEKNVPVGPGGMQSYRPGLKNGAPNVCFKVPTGGGKTLIAASAIQTIYRAMPVREVQAVVWLVPSDAILAQTYAALSNPSHPYRQKIEADFGGRVEVYSKSALLNGQNFSPAAVSEQLSIFVLSYDSFRSSKKEGRKAFQENGSLASFPKFMQDRAALLPDTDETALIQVIRSFNPLVIVDESHHAVSRLSVEMLENFNPCFVLDLTATPQQNSNIISFADAAQLKRANMVKLPVIVYNRRTQEDVFADAIHIRDRLEARAEADRQASGRYIRPIALFQAQPKNTAESSTTYEKIKSALVAAGIPQQEIAVKTADRDELKNVDLLSPQCPIRYIITVNALKEGWDCPFAYVLATVANRNSAVDVEQILGRVLRLPYTQKNKSDVLNISYVITSSVDFGRTLDKVVQGLNQAGFSSRDCRAEDAGADADAPQKQYVQMTLAPQNTDSSADAENADAPDIRPEVLRDKMEARRAEDGALDSDEAERDPLLSVGLAQNAEYEKNIENELAADGGAAIPEEVREKMTRFRMNAQFAEEASRLRLPQFKMRTAPSFFSDNEYVRLEAEHLSEGFTLKDKDIRIDFETLDAEMARVDTDVSSGDIPKAWKMKGADCAYYRQWMDSLPSAQQLTVCKKQIKAKISKIDCVNDREVENYIGRIVENMTADQVSDMIHSPWPYIHKIENKIKELLLGHRADVFRKWLEQEIIICGPNYQLKSEIAPQRHFSRYPKSLYAEEESVNKYEEKLIFELSSMDNIKWWHRNISRQGFYINGAISAYPDILVMTESGRILAVEAKGDYLDNDESRAKAALGAAWASCAGKEYRYFMVFESKSPDYPGAYSYDRFMEIVKAL